MTAKYATLAELAQKATPGPWRYLGPYAVSRESEDIASPSSEHAPVCRGHDYDDYGYIEPADAAYIAAADPSTITALLAELAAAQAVVEAARELPAPDLDAEHRGYHVASHDPDFIALIAALAAYDETIRAPKGGGQP